MKNKPKNGSYFIALIAGGDGNQLASMRKQLAERGVVVVAHWPPSAHLDKRELRPDLDLIFIFQDNRINHKTRTRLAFKARKHAFVVEVTSVPTAMMKLERYGFRGKQIDLSTLSEPAVTPPDTQEHAEEAEDSEGQAEVAVAPAPPSAREAQAVAPPSPLSYAEAGKLVKQTRLEQKMERKDLGARVGCSDSTIGNLERGKDKIPLSSAMCRAIEATLGLRIGIIPRLAQRDNHRLPSPPVQPAVTAPAKLDAPPDPVENMRRIKALQAHMEATDPVIRTNEAELNKAFDKVIADHEADKAKLCAGPPNIGSVFVALLRLRQLMGEAGIVRVELTATNMAIEEKQP